MYLVYIEQSSKELGPGHVYCIYTVREKAVGKEVTRTMVKERKRETRRKSKETKQTTALNLISQSKKIYHSANWNRGSAMAGTRAVPPPVLSVDSSIRTIPLLFFPIFFM